MSSGEKEPGGYYPTPPKRRRLNPRIDLTGDSAGGAEPDPPVNVPVPVAPVPVVPVAPVVVVPESPRQERCYMCDMNRCFWRAKPGLLPIPPHIMELNREMDQAKRAWVRARISVIHAELEWEQSLGY